MGTRVETAPARFEAKCLPEPNSGCLLWTGCVAGNKYGSFHDGERLVGAHTYSYRLNRGPIQKGRMVCHTCDTPLCVNPDHLFVGSPSMNQQDALKKGRSARAAAFGWSHSPELKERIRQDPRPYQVIADEYGLKRTQVKNIKTTEARSFWRHRNVEIRNENDRLREALHEAERQIVYLHEKFAPTGSGEQVLAKIRAALGQ